MRAAAIAGLLLLLGPLAAALPAAPAELAAGPLARGQAFLDREVLLGRSADDWRAWAHARFDAAPSAAAPVPLTEALESLYAALELQPSADERAVLAAAAARVEGDAAGALGALVAALAQATRDQRAVAAAVDASAPARGEPLLPLTATAAGIANAERVLAAVEAFRPHGAALPPAGFRDPLGLVVVGTPGDDVHPRGTGTFPDPVLLLDPAGNDLDLTAAGGACPLPVDAPADCNGLPLAVRVDLAGDDTYRFAAAHGVAQGAGAFGGLGILLDAGGNDRYEAEQRAGHGPFGTYYINGVVQGSGEGGLGLLLDGGGDDVYRLTASSPALELFAMGQGFAGLGGLGALLDAGGADLYDASASCTGARGQFCGLYVQATAIYPGVALLVDAGTADDVYRGVLVAPQEDYYSQAFAAFGSFALQVDEGGDDDYFASATSTNTNAAVSLNCAFGTAMYAGAVAVFLDAAGDDRYLAATFSPNPAHTMAEGYALASAALFWDVRGADRHEMVAQGPSGSMILGRGLGSNPTEGGALYLDTGGPDAYPDGIGADGARWGPENLAAGGGADVNLL